MNLPLGLKISSIEDIKTYRFNDIKTLQQIEKEHIIHVLNELNDNITEAAHYLGIARYTVYKKMKKHNIIKEQK